MDALWECTVREWTAATVVLCRHYSPEIPLLLRTGSFGVLEAKLLDSTAVGEDPAPAPPTSARTWKDPVADFWTSLRGRL